jgi:hypothetical protein
MSPSHAPRPHERHASALPGARLLSLVPLLLSLLHCGDEGGGESNTGGNGACPSDLPSPDACADGAPSYRLDVAPIIDERCNVCHYPGNRQSSVAFSDHAALYSRRQTVQSRIYSCVMPPEPAPPLTPGERATLLEWLVCGAPEE